ncbi:MAG: hypothetical protein CML66_02975 [Rhodobacteraceae bacterium]|nr:hypothetical protein [Paracoccaceae bacterium]MAY47909.1 hypothetical protein [Paracoccaceae bacterium]
MLRGSTIATAFLCLTAPVAALAQESLQTRSFPDMTNVGEKTVGLRRGSFILAPIPLRDPMIGTGLALGAGYLFNIDAKSDPSGIGIGGFKTDNGSQAYAAGGSLSFGEGHWKIRGGMGYADLNYDLYAGDTPIPISQTGAMARLGVTYTWSHAWSIGFDLGVIQSDLGSGGATLPPDLQPDFDITSATADLTLGYDTRDDTLYPTSGVKASFRFGLGGVADGIDLNVIADLDRQFTRMLGQYALYLPVGSDGVVAGLITACGVDDQTPFFLACSLGGSDQMRGFPATQYIDNTLVSLQMAYRGRIGQSRFGYVVFAGAGRVADGFSDIGSADTHAAAGVGARFRVSRKFPVDFSVDLAVNDDHDTTTYIYVGQRF